MRPVAELRAGLGLPSRGQDRSTRNTIVCQMFDEAVAPRHLIGSSVGIASATRLQYSGRGRWLAGRLRHHRIIATGEDAES